MRAGLASSEPKGGFTFVELVLAFGLSLVLSTLVFNVLLTQSQSFSTQELLVGTQSNVQMAMNNLARNVRRSAYDVHDSLITSRLFAFADDTLGIYYKDPGVGRIRRLFYVDATDTSNPKLTMVEKDSAGTTTTSTQTIAEGIRRVQFRYMVEGGTPAADTTLTDPPVTSYKRVRGIWFKITARSSRQKATGGYTTMETEMLVPTPNING